MKKNYGLLLGLATEIAVLIVGMVYLGRLVDKTYHLEGKATAGGIILAFAVWIYHLTVALKRLNEEENDD